MASKADGILSAITAVLEATTGLSGTVYRSRTDAISRGESPAIVLRPNTENVAYPTHDIAQRALVVDVEVIARGVVPDSQADPARVLAHRALMADRELSGLSLDIEELGSQWNFSEGDDEAISIVTRYQVHYRTAQDDIEVSP